MLDQKAEVQRLYRDLSMDESWKGRYAQDPQAIFDHYGILAHNRELLARIIDQHIRRDRWQGDKGHGHG